MSDDDKMDMVRNAVSDCGMFFQRQMPRDDVSDSLFELLAYVLDRDPTTKEVDDVLG